MIPINSISPFITDSFRNDLDLIVQETKIKNRDLKKIYAEVFDTKTITVLKTLTNRHAFNKIERLIATGKEGNIFKGYKDSEKCAVKIYRIETSSFDKMSKYIENDFRFKGIKKNKMNLVYEWAKKEFKNLKTAKDAGVNVPFPITYLKNVLVMEFLGKEEAHPVLKEDNLSIQKHIKDIFKQTIHNLHNLTYKAKLVHADLSEWNMIYFNKKLYFIDMGQAVPLTHQHSREFYNRDIKNIAKFFNKYDFNLTEEDLKQMIKSNKIHIL